MHHFSLPRSFSDIEKVKKISHHYPPEQRDNLKKKNWLIFPLYFGKNSLDLFSNGLGILAISQGSQDIGPGNYILRMHRNYSEHVLGFPTGSAGKESSCNAGDAGSIPGSGRLPGGGNSNPLQYSCLKKVLSTEEPGGLPSKWPQRVGRGWETKHTCFRHFCSIESPDTSAGKIVLMELSAFCVNAIEQPYLKSQSH